MIEDKVLLTNVVIIFLVIILIGVISYATFIYDRDSFSCVNNPLEHFEQLNNVSCQCKERQIWNDLNYSNIQIRP